MFSLGRGFFWPRNGGQLHGRKLVWFPSDAFSSTWESGERKPPGFGSFGAWEFARLFWVWSIFSLPRSFRWIVGPKESLSRKGMGLSHGRVVHKTRTDRVSYGSHMVGVDFSVWSERVGLWIIHVGHVHLSTIHYHTCRPCSSEYHTCRNNFKLGWPALIATRLPFPAFGQVNLDSRGPGLATAPFFPRMSSPVFFCFLLFWGSLCFLLARHIYIYIKCWGPNSSQALS